MPAPTDNNSRTRTEWLAAALVAVAVLWLHFHFWQNAGALWRDEVNTVNLAQNPSFAALTHDSFPVLMPLSVKIWSALGRSDSWLRLLGMIFGLLIPLAFWLVARAARKPPLFSLVLFGLNSLMICYGDSLRAYGLGSALIVLALAVLWSFLKKPDWTRAGILAFVATLSVQALFQNAILFFAISLGAFAVCARQRNFPAALKIVCAGTIAALSLLPYYHHFVELPQSAVELRRGFSLFVTNFNFEIATGFPFGFYTTVWKILAVLVVGLGLLSLWRKKTGGLDNHANLQLFAGVTLAAVVVLFLAFLRFAAAGARPWYFIPPLALAGVCFDLGIPLTRLPRLVRVAVLALLLGTALVAGTFAWTDLRGHFTNADQMALRVGAKSSPEDFIIVTPWFCGITFDRYFKSATPWQTLPPLADHATHRYDLVLKQMQDTNCLEPVLEKISATLRAGHRVWVVGLMDMPASDAKAPPVLPPPPLKNYGWSDTPYVSSWAAHTAYFLARQSTNFSALPDDGDGAALFQENLHLFLAEGWRASGPANSASPTNPLQNPHEQGH